MVALIPRPLLGLNERTDLLRRRPFLSLVGLIEGRVMTFADLCVDLRSCQALLELTLLNRWHTGFALHGALLNLASTYLHLIKLQLLNIFNLLLLDVHHMIQGRFTSLSGLLSFGAAVWVVGW